MFDKKINEDWNEELLWNEVDEIFNELDIPIKISMSVNDLSEIIQ